MEMQWLKASFMVSRGGLCSSWHLFAYSLLEQYSQKLDNTTIPMLYGFRKIPAPQHGNPAHRSSG